MPVISTPNSPSRADESVEISHDPRLRKNKPNNGPAEPTESGDKASTFNDTVVHSEWNGEIQEAKDDFDMKHNQESADTKPNIPNTWTMEQIEEFFITHGYKDEVEYVKTAELDTEKAGKLGSDTLAPVTTFSLKMGLRVLELIKILKKLSEAPASGAGTGASGGTASSLATTH